MLWRRVRANTLGVEPDALDVLIRITCSTVERLLWIPQD